MALQLSQEKNRAEHMSLSMEDPDDMEPQQSQIKYFKEFELSVNVYNAYLISKYKSSRRVWKQCPWFIRFYITILPYFIAVVQWAAVIIVILVQYYGFEGRADNWTEFNLYPDDKWKPKSLMWPFWFIAIAYTYQKSLTCECDIWALKWDNIVVFDLSDTACKWNLEVFFLKHLTEGFLNQWGGIFYYAVVAGCSDFRGLGGIFNLILNILGYIFIFDLDEYAYHLVKDIFIFSFSHNNSTHDPKSPFYGQLMFNIDGSRQAALRLLGVFFASLSIQGIFYRSYLIMFLFGGLWLITEIIKVSVGGHQYNLCIKTRKK